MKKHIISLFLFILFPCMCYSHTDIVIFGATGDLTVRKLFPAIYNLANDGHLNDDYTLVGVGRRSLSQEQFQISIYDSVQKYSRSKLVDSVWSSFLQHVFYHEADFQQEIGYANLKKLLEQRQGQQRDTIFFLATESRYFPFIISKLHQHGLINSSSRVIIEKPFGYDLDSSIALQNSISEFLDEKQIYRIDHYLGKTGVRVLSHFRFHDSQYEWLFHRNYVKNIQFTLSETIGIGTRANFYENTGHLRDVVQNHAMQLLALAMMNKPEANSPENIHREKILFFDAIRPYRTEEIDNFIIRGQYGPGIIQNNAVLGYKQENGVSDSSDVETFVQVKLYVDNDRWRNVPIYIRSGKRLEEQTAQITFNLKDNLLGIKAITLSIQPQSNIFISTTDGTYIYDVKIEDSVEREAYENLLLAAVQSDQSDFVTIDEVNSAWRIFTPVLNHWNSKSLDESLIYEAGSWGPNKAIQQLLDEGVDEWNIISNKK